MGGNLRGNQLVPEEPKNKTLTHRGSDFWSENLNSIRGGIPCRDSQRATDEEGIKIGTGFRRFFVGIPDSIFSWRMYGDTGFLSRDASSKGRETKAGMRASFPFSRSGWRGKEDSPGADPDQDPWTGSYP